MKRICALAMDGRTDGDESYANKVQYLLNDGWEIIHTNTFNTMVTIDSGVMANTTVFTAILQKEE